MSDTPAKREFPSVEVPSMYTDPAERTIYAAQHFWDRFTDTSRVYACDSLTVNGVESNVPDGISSTVPINGVTASGTLAKHGTAAADTSCYPFGTILHVPGYGYATVEDRGGDIKGPHRLDLWFPTEREARKWGRRKNVSVTVWPPKRN